MTMFISDSINKQGEVDNPFPPIAIPSVTTLPSTLFKEMTMECCVTPELDLLMMKLEISTV